MSRTRDKVIFSGVKQVSIKSFFISLTSYHTKIKVFNLPYYLPIGGERIIGFIPSPKVLTLCGMQAASSSSWTQVMNASNSLTSRYLTLPINKYVFQRYLWPSWLGLQNTLTASLQRGKTPPTSHLDLTLNNLMVRLQ